ncbi:hypothetical protein [Victivallis sp. Marseille-Q1083]|uniref:hypothetical protein n=1 Tax=Victivallis sp. Marseille-Q1083 TaxID=2717288 RepID=UPI00158E52DA|nr:hypothetical protein [Victivallis sp. Marseille-Q1083]
MDVFELHIGTFLFLFAAENQGNPAFVTGVALAVVATLLDDVPKTLILVHELSHLQAVFAVMAGNGAGGLAEVFNRLFEGLVSRFPEIRNQLARVVSAPAVIADVYGFQLAGRGAFPAFG